MDRTAFAARKQISTSITKTGNDGTKHFKVKG